MKESGTSEPERTMANPSIRAGRRAKNKLPIILDAATRVFASKGYHGSTIADVAAAAGVATGTIYLYVKRKEDLLVSLFQNRMGPHLDEREGLLRSLAPGEEQVAGLVESHLAFYQRNEQLARVFQLHTREPHPVIRAGIRPLMRRYFADIEALLREGVEAGALDHDLDVRAARTVLFGSLDATVTAWVLADRRYSLLSQRDSLTTMLSRAIGATPPGGGPAHDTRQRG